MCPLVTSQTRKSDTNSPAGIADVWILLLLLVCSSRSFCCLALILPCKVLGATIQFGAPGSSAWCVSFKVLWVKVELFQGCLDVFQSLFLPSSGAVTFRELSVQDVAGQSVRGLANDVASPSELSWKNDFFYWGDVDVASYLSMGNPIPLMQSKE